MTEIPEEALDLLKEEDLNIVLSTLSEDNEPNAVPINNLWLKDKETLLVGDVFFDKTRSNLKETKKAVVSYWKGTKGFQLKGDLEKFQDSGSLFEEKREELKEMDLELEYLVIIKVNEVYVTTPGPGAGKKIS